MIKNIIYKYERTPGRLTISPRRPLCTYTQMFRLIADEGKILTNDGGQTQLHCIDVENLEGWVEIDLPVQEEINFTEN